MHCMTGKGLVVPLLICLVQHNASLARLRGRRLPGLLVCSLSRVPPAYYHTTCCST